MYIYYIHIFTQRYMHKTFFLEIYTKGRNDERGDILPF